MILIWSSKDMSIRLRFGVLKKHRRHDDLFDYLLDCRPAHGRLFGDVVCDLREFLCSRGVVDYQIVFNNGSFACKFHCPLQVRTSSLKLPSPPPLPPLSRSSSELSVTLDSEKAHSPCDALPPVLSEEETEQT